MNLRSAHCKLWRVHLTFSLQPCLFYIDSVEHESRRGESREEGREGNGGSGLEIEPVQGMV